MKQLKVTYFFAKMPPSDNHPPYPKLDITDLLVYDEEAESEHIACWGSVARLNASILAEFPQHRYVYSPFRGSQSEITNFFECKKVKESDCMRQPSARKHLKF